MKSSGSNSTSINANDEKSWKFCIGRYLESKCETDLELNGKFGK